MRQNNNPECSDLTDRSLIAVGRLGTTAQRGCQSIQNFVYSIGMVQSKPVEFRGSALDDLRAFPEAARREGDISSTKSSMGASRTTGNR
jgi:hypothetical protein